jgi:hypothetical protein
MTNTMKFQDPPEKKRERRLPDATSTEAGHSQSQSASELDVDMVERSPAPQTRERETNARSQAAFRKELAEHLARLDQAALLRIRNDFAAHQGELNRLAREMVDERGINGGLEVIREAFATAERSVADLRELFHASQLDDFLDSQQRQGVITRMDITLADIPQHDRDRLRFAALPPVAVEEFEAAFLACIRGQEYSLAENLRRVHRKLQDNVMDVQKAEHLDHNRILPKVMLGIALLESADAAAEDCQEYSKHPDLWRSLLASFLFAGAFALIHLGVEAYQTGIAGFFGKQIKKAGKLLKRFGG